MLPLALRGVALLKVEANRNPTGVNFGPFRFDRLSDMLFRVKRGLSLRALSVKAVLNFSTRSLLRWYENSRAVCCCCAGWAECLGTVLGAEAAESWAADGEDVAEGLSRDRTDILPSVSRDRDRSPFVSMTSPISARLSFCLNPASLISKRARSKPSLSP